MLKTFMTYLLMVFVGLISNEGQANDRGERIDSLMHVFHDYGMFNGAVLAAEEDEIIYKSAFGKANFEWGIPNKTDTRFKIASITKAYTASLVLHLDELGKLSLDDVITDYLSEYPAETGNRITLEHLLVQSAGIPDYITQSDFLSTEAKLHHDKREFIKKFAHKDLEFEPGTDWNYGNSGYYLLGLIIEEATGMSYASAMEKYILKPNELHNSGYAASEKIIDQLAEGYVRTPEGFEKAPYFHSSAGFSAGMMYSTVEDMFRWTRALASGDIVRHPYHLQNMITPQMEDYGFGFFIGEQRIGDRNELVFSHSGNINGYSSQLSYFSDSDYTLIIMDNTQQCTARIFFALREVLFGEPAPIVREPVANLLGEKIQQEGVERAVEYYWELKEERGEECDFSIRELSRLADYYKSHNDYETAIPILELTAEIFPNNKPVKQKLANAYYKVGKVDKADEVVGSTENSVNDTSD